MGILTGAAAVTASPLVQTIRARWIFLALLLMTGFSLSWNSHTVDTVALAINASMWFLMAMESHREIREIRKSSDLRD